MKKFAFVVLILFLGILFDGCKFINSATERNVPPEVIASSIEIFGKLIDSTNYNKFGFSQENQVQTLKAGIQIRKYFIELSKIKNYNGIDSIEQMVNLNYSIEIPLADSTNKMFTSIEYNVNQKNEWEGTGFGFTPSMFKLIKKYGTSFPTKFVLIEVPAMKFCFVHELDKTSKNQRNKILTNKSLNGDDITELSDIDILEQLKQNSKKFNSNFPG